jgi:hypothetical protein
MALGQVLLIFPLPIIMYIPHTSSSSSGPDIISPFKTALLSLKHHSSIFRTVKPISYKPLYNKVLDMTEFSIMKFSVTAVSFAG